MTKSHRRLIAAAVLALGAIAVPTASAGSLLTQSSAATGAGACSSRVLSSPFSQWSDTNSYFPAPAGTFESGAPGWTLTGGAAVVSGGDPFLSSATGSLALPANATATSPWICVDPGTPTMRFFTTGKGSVSVSAVSGSLVVPFGTIAPNTRWAPTPPLVFLISALSLLTPTGSLAVEFRFTAVNAAAQVDDVYVDPYKRT